MNKKMTSRARTVPMAAGFVKQGFERVEHIFRQNLETGIERGASFAAYHKGELVVNLWGGFADEAARRPWKYNSASIFYSSTKSVAAIVMAHLVEAGLVSYDKPVCSYWPQFAQNGKENLTLKHILSLKAGLPVLTDPFKLTLLRDDPEKLEELLAKQTPWNTGDVAAYSPIVIGLYLDCIVRKVDPKKRSLSQYFQDVFAKPFGIDFYIGMPKSEFWRNTRQSVTMRGDEYKQYQLKLTANPNIDQQLLLTSGLQPSDFLRNSHINNPEFVELPCPSSHGVGSAAGMAKLHGILANGGCSQDGRRLLSENTIRLLQDPLFIGKEKMFGSDFVYSYGMELLPVLEDGELHYNMGHGGFGGQFAAADPKHRTGWAYCTNYLDPTIFFAGKTKWNALEQSLFQCVHAEEGVKVIRRHINDHKQLQDALQKLKHKL